MKKERSIPMIFRATQFGTDVMAARAEMEVSQAVVAHHIGISASWVSDVENGNEVNMKMQNFLAMCNLFDLNPQDYFELES